MMKLQICSIKLASSVLIGAILAPSVARAECYPIERAPLEADCVVMPYGEQRGVWLRLDRAEELRKLKLVAPELQRQVDLYSGVTKALVQARNDYQKAYASQIDATRQMGIANKSLAADARRSRQAKQEAEAKLDAWYRSPFVWFGAGIVATLAIGFSATYATK